LGEVFFWGGQNFPTWQQKKGLGGEKKLQGFLFKLSYLDNRL
jgi:hypothetical protein